MYVGSITNDENNDKEENDGNDENNDKEENDDLRATFEYSIYASEKIKRIQVPGGGGLPGGNVSAHIEVSLNDDGEPEGPIFYVEWGPEYRREFVGTELVFDDEGVSFNVV
jgi:hypothetical protein